MRMIIIKVAWSWRRGRGGLGGCVASGRSGVEKDDRLKSLSKRTSMLLQQTYLPGSSHSPSENMNSKLTREGVSLHLTHEQVLVFLAQREEAANIRRDRLKERGVHTPLTIVNINLSSYRFYYRSPAAERHQPRCTNFDPATDVGNKWIIIKFVDWWM